jgi:signal transduction histidine kinase
MPGNVVALRLVAFITFFGMSLFLTIDLFRDVDYSVTFLARSVALGVAAALMALSFRSNLNVQTIYLSVIVLAAANFGVALVTATYARMPAYYLTNLLFLIFVLVITASGLNFRHALFLNVLCLMVFVVYSNYVRIDPFYYSQYPHLFSIFVYIHMVGLVLESRRRLNFLQFNDLKKQKEMVEELNQQKNKIISILSHDVASPLNSLAGLVSLQNKNALSAEETKEAMANIGERLEAVSAMLHSLTRWSRSQMEGFVPDRKAIDAVASLQEVVRLFQSLAREKSVNIQLSVPEACRVVGDHEMLQLVFRNLLSNAVKFTAFYAHVSISVRSKANGLVVIEFANESNGIPTEVKEKLFSYQIGSTVGTAGEKGTGLGLAMSAYFIQLNGGRIYLDDTRNGWVIFGVELPAAVS